MDKPNIICVDDERMVLTSLREQLKSKFGNHYQIVITDSSRDALDIVAELRLRNKEIPLIISDYIMPDLKGDELLKRIREANPRTVAILLTGQATIQGVTSTVNQAGIYKYIEKPWDKENLYEIVSQALDYYHTQLHPAMNQELVEINSHLAQTIQHQTAELTINQNLLASTEQSQYIRGMVEEITTEINRSLQTIKYGVDVIHDQQKAIYENCPESMSIYLKSVTEFYQTTSEIFDYMVDAFDCNSNGAPAQPNAGDGFTEIYRKTSAIGNRVSEKVKTMVTKTYEVETQSIKKIEKVVAWDDEVIHLFNIEDLLFFTVEEGSTMVVTKKGKYKMKAALNVLENRLVNQNFFRCHKSYLINLVFISQIIPWIGNSNYIAKIEGFPYEIPISRTYLKEMKELLGI